MPEPFSEHLSSSGLHVIIAAVFTTLGVILKAAFDYLKQRHKDDLEADQNINEQIVKGYNLTIAKLDARITALEAELRKTREEHKIEMAAVRAEHVECLRVQGQLKSDIASLTTRIAHLTENITDVK